MNWEAIGAVGETLGALAVLVTLVYLAVQIRQNNRNLHESTSAAVNQGWGSINSRLSSDAQFAEIFIRGRDNLEALDPVELERFRAFVQDILNMAVWADGLQSSHNYRSLNFDALEVVGSLYKTYPGVRSVIDSVEQATPRNLVRRLGQAKPSYSFIGK